MSKMKLTHLKVELMADSARALRATLLFGNNFRYWGADHGEAIRTVLQAQPLLESLSFVGCSFSEETLENLPSHLVHSVVPRLKCLTGKPDIVAAFIGVFPGLEYLGIVECFWDEGMVTDMKRSPVTNRASISKLSVQIENPDKEFWKHFGRILALFPNTETLQLQVVIVRRIRKWSPDGQFEPGEDCFSSIKKAISPLSALRHLDLAGEMVYSMKEGTADDAQESFIAECKIACPRLESFIDHKGRLWEYKLESDEGGAGSFKHVGVVEKMEDRGPKDDLPYERDEDNDEDEGEGEDDGGDNDDEGEAREKDEEYEGAEDEAWGSRRLLQTFIIRPDLALLVRHLEFSTFDSAESPYNWNDVPQVLKPDETNALSMAKNIRSLALVGPTDWIYGPNQTGFRDAVSKMKLTQLKLERMADSPIALRSARRLGHKFRYLGPDYAEEIRGVLHAQPLLESLSIVGCSFSMDTLYNLPSQLVYLDLPRLKCLTGNPDIAAAFIGALPGLEYLNIIECYWTEQRVTSMEKSPVANRASISKLSVQMVNPDKKCWQYLGGILALFSNTETLQLQVVIKKYCWPRNPHDQSEPGEDYFSTIIQFISLLSALRHLEFAGKMVYPVKDGAADDVQESFIAECKIACPQLESFIDHKGRLWEYKLESDQGGAGSFKQVGVMEKMEDRGPTSDFPYENEENDEDNDGDEGEGEANAKEKDEDAEDGGNEGDEN
ncbi:hypothetical protein FRC00_013116 [Tulasnella sp. 408]|nr:hypothetical protein FRC00_013116 [Tulasnella sp. 408]